MDNTQQLPAEVQSELARKAFAYSNQQHAHDGDDIHVGYIAGATEYAIKLHQIEQERDRAISDFKRVQQSAIHYANRKMEVEKQRDALQADLHTARTLLEKIITRHGVAINITDPELYNEIKQFLK